MPGFSSEALTANEAASVTRVPLKQVHRIIDAGLLRGRVKTRSGSRVIVGSGLVGLRLAWLTAETLTPAAWRRIVETAIAGEAVSGVADNPLRVDLKPIAAEVKTGLSRLKKAKAMATRDPDVLGGQPVFAGTRVPVHDVADMLANGDTAERSIPPIRSSPSTRSGSRPPMAGSSPSRSSPVKPAWRSAPANHRARSLSAIRRPLTSNATSASFLVSASQISWNARLAFDLALRQLVQHIGGRSCAPRNAARGWSAIPRLAPSRTRAHRRQTALTVTGAHSPRIGHCSDIDCSPTFEVKA